MIYFDSAATTLQKPTEVKAAMQNALETMSSPGRGGHAAAILAAETTFQCRTELAEMFGLNNPERVIFTLNATHALNIAIKTLVPEEGTVVISGYEHNSVTRPLSALKADIKVAQSPLFRQDIAADRFAQLITPDTDAVICNHVSNVFGYVQPIEKIAKICQERGVPLIIDASQSAGVIPLNMEALQAAFIAMPGHKGLYGPQGTGVLLCREDIQAKPLIEGGTGSSSIQQKMPDFLPDRLEAGTHNMPGIAGLLEGVRYVRRKGETNIGEWERRLAFLAADRICMIPNAESIVAHGLRNQTGVLSIQAKTMDAEQLGLMLAERGIAVRAGLHCAPLAHKSAGTLEKGTVRLSFSSFNTMDEVYQFIEELEDCLAG